MFLSDLVNNFFEERRERRRIYNMMINKIGFYGEAYDFSKYNFSKKERLYLEKQLKKGVNVETFRSITIYGTYSHFARYKLKDERLQKIDSWDKHKY